jgi:hypothetical protein
MAGDGTSASGLIEAEPKLPSLVLMRFAWGAQANKKAGATAGLFENLLFVPNSGCHQYFAMVGPPQR